MNIIILHAYGDKNIGDAAILLASIKLLNKVYPVSEHTYTVMAEDTESLKTIDHYKKHINKIQSPYGYAIRKGNGKRASSITKIVKFAAVSINSLFFALSYKIFKKKVSVAGVYSYITSIYNADIVFAMGGGYLLSKHKYKDYFGLLLTLLPMMIAKLFGKRIIFLPMSYGPFASKLQEKITLKVLKQNIFIARDSITLQRLHQSDTHNHVKKYTYPDLALYLEKIQSLNILHKFNSRTVVLTGREWMSARKQRYYEEQLTEFIKTMWKEYSLQAVFIPMAWNSIEDDDNTVANRIDHYIQDSRIFRIRKVSTPQAVIESIDQARLCICTRMHSAILSSIRLTPFITISYLDKTMGFLKDYNLEEWNIPIEDASYEKLKLRFDKLHSKQEYEDYICKLQKRNETLSSYEKNLLNDLYAFTRPN